MWVGGVHLLLLCATGSGLIGGTLRPSPVNPVLASAPRLSVHILFLLSQEDPLPFPWQQILPGSHPRPTPRETEVWGSLEPPSHTPYTGGRSLVTKQWHRTELRLVAGNLHAGVGVLAFRTCSAPPLAPRPPSVPACRHCLSKPAQGAQPACPLNWGDAALPTMEVSHMGGPAFISRNSHTETHMCVGRVPCTTMTCERQAGSRGSFQQGWQILCGVQPLQSSRPGMVSGPSGWRGPAAMKLCWWTRKEDACLWALRTTWPPSAWTTSASGPRRYQGPPALALPREGAPGPHSRLLGEAQRDGPPEWTLSAQRPRQGPDLCPLPPTSL